MRTEVLCIYVSRVGSGPRVKLAGYKSALNLHPTPHPHTHIYPATMVYSTDRSKAMVTDTKRKRIQTKQIKRKSNKRTKSTKISSLSPSEEIAMLKGLKNTRTK